MNSKDKDNSMKPISSFFGRKCPVISEVISIENSNVKLKRCGICNKKLTPQGWPNHIRKHVSDGDINNKVSMLEEAKSFSPIKYGKVKIRDGNKKKKLMPMMIIK